MKYLPSLSEALLWCSEAGVNKKWGGMDLSSEKHASFCASIHEKTEELESVRKIVVHRSGFQCGNASLLRWYHRVVNGWRDVGYHLVIGNGQGGYSVQGAVELGRPLHLIGAHCSKHNKDSIAVCLIDSHDHFQDVPPSTIELHSLGNALLFLLEGADPACRILGHSDLAPAACPGPAVPVKMLEERVQTRRALIRHTESAASTLDLRHVFGNATLDFRDPKHGMNRVAGHGFTRIVYPYHWLRRPWEDLELAREWTKEAHGHGVDVLLYTGCFGTEPRDFLRTKPGSKDWLQRKADGTAATYDTDGRLLMFCPSSPYLAEHRVPIVMEFLKHTGCDGLFLDIPWIVRNACYCGSCSGKGSKPTSALLHSREQSVRTALAEGVIRVREEFPNAWLTVNAGAPYLWKGEEVGASPASLCGLFDELVVEWTPGRASEIEGIQQSIVHCRLMCPTSRISHAWNPKKTGALCEDVRTLEIQEGVGKWLVGSSEVLM